MIIAADFGMTATFPRRALDRVAAAVRTVPPGGWRVISTASSLPRTITS